MIAKRLIAVAALLSAPSAALAVTTLSDGSFESQGPASTTDYCYFGGSCTNTPWTGAGAGIQIETNGAFPGLPTPAGQYYAFVQNSGVLGQQFTADTGIYTLSWLDAGRPAGPGLGGNQNYNVELRTLVGNGFTTLVLGSYSTTSGQGFTAKSAAPVALVSGLSYVLAYQGTTTGDNTAFIDAVAFDEAGAVPEPATWAMMLVGFGGMGYAMRRRKAAVSFG